MGPAQTRRELLAAAGAGALGALALPSLASARRPGADPELVSLAVGTVGAAPRAVELPVSAAMFGLQWRAPRAARIEARFAAAEGRWSPWVPAGGVGHAPDGDAPPSTGEPLWARATRRIELRAPRPVEGVLVHALPATPARADAAAGPTRALPRLAAGAGQPVILARLNWAGRHSPPSTAPLYGNVEMAFVHHTDSPNGYSAAEVPAMIRGIYVFHRFVNGWDDIGYNFVVDLYGRIWEARAGGIDQSVIGAHAGGFNTYSSGVAVLGNFQSTDVTSQTKRALAALIGWKLALHGAPSRGRLTVRATRGAIGHSAFAPGSRVTLPRIAGHRDADQTGCPGRVLYDDLPAMRTRIHAAFPQPARLTLTAARADATPPEGAPPGPLRLLAGRLTGAGGEALAGASIEIQQRSVTRRGEQVVERTLADAVTDAEGNYLVALPAGTRGVLRALSTAAGRLGAVLSPDLYPPRT